MPSFVHVSRISTFSIKGMYYFIIRKAAGNVTSKKRKSAFGKFPHPPKPVTCTGSEMTRHVPGTVGWREQHPNICTGTVWNLESIPFPGEEAGSEKWVFCCFSCKQALGSHPFPLPLPSLSHIFSNSESLSKTSTTELAHSLGKFPTGTESQDPSVLGDGFEGKSEDQKRWTNALHRIPEALFYTSFRILQWDHPGGKND